VFRSNRHLKGAPFFMDNTKYIGMDVHTETISIAVLNSAGKLVMESVIETKPVAGLSSHPLTARSEANSKPTSTPPKILAFSTEPCSVTVIRIRTDPSMCFSFASPV
jgi:hypothetical protein